MPIVYVHGVAVRDDDAVLARMTKRLGEVPWPTIAAQLREHVAPAISDDPDGVPIQRIYWGDLGARFTRGGRSLVSRPLDPATGPSGPPAVGTAVTPEVARGLGRVADPVPAQKNDAVRRSAPRPAPVGAQPAELDRPERPEWVLRREQKRRARALRERGRASLRSTVTALRRPFEDFLPTFIGDVMTYVAQRGTAQAPGAIPLRILDGLDAAAFAAASRDEPLVVLTHSMGGQILYDVLTHFIPRMPRYHGIRVDFWCSTASQVGYFEELGLFLESDPDRLAAGRLTPRPEHLRGWWNVWDHADLLSFRAEGIFADVDDTAFYAAGTLATDHFKYLAQPELYRLFGERVRASLGSAG